MKLMTNHSFLFFSFILLGIIEAIWELRVCQNDAPSLFIAISTLQFSCRQIRMIFTKNFPICFPFHSKKVIYACYCRKIHSDSTFL